MITETLRAALSANGRDGTETHWASLPPLAKLFTPDAGSTWLLVASDSRDADRVWGLRDIADGEPRLAWDSLKRLSALRGPLGRQVMLDEAFIANADITTYAEEAIRVGIILA